MLKSITQKFETLSFKWKIISLFLLMAFAFSSLLLLSNAKIQGLKSSIVVDEKTEALTKVEVELFSQYEGVLFLALNASAGSGMSSDEAQAKVKMVQASIEKLDQSVGVLDSKIQEKYSVYSEEYKKILNLLIEESSLEAAERALTKLPSKFSTLIDDLNSEIQARIQTQKENSNELISSIDSFSVVLGIFTLVILVVFCFAVSFALSYLLRPLETAKEKLLTFSDKLQKNSSELETKATTLATSSNQASDSITETVSAINEITGMVESNLENVKNSMKKSTEAAETAKSGNGAVQEMLTAMKSIEGSNNDIVKETDSVTKSLEEIANIIADIKSKTSVINDIVFQTKLLSFNASVEAARAGERGKGFAVVAEEIGKLATASGGAANEISNLLANSEEKVSSIVASAKTNLERSSKKGKENVTSGYDRAQDCSTALQAILKIVAEVDEMVDQINSSSQEQSAGIVSLNESLNSINAMSNQSSSIAGNVLDTSEELGREVAYLQAVANEMEALLRGRRNAKVAKNNVIDARDDFDDFSSSKAS